MLRLRKRIDEEELSREKLAKFVRDEMTRGGQTVRGLGDASGTGQSYIERLRRGDPGPAENLAKVSIALGLAPGELLNVYSDFNPDEGLTEKLVKDFLLLQKDEQDVVIEIVRLFRLRPLASELPLETLTTDNEQMRAERFEEMGNKAQDRINEDTKSNIDEGVI